jgi:excisionase family DNA binding protein
MPETLQRRKLTPPQVAARLGVSRDKILTWVRNGPLRAVNAATRTGGRPRWLIDVVDLELFERSRSATAPPKQQKRRQRDEQVIEFY